MKTCFKRIMSIAAAALMLSSAASFAQDGDSSAMAPGGFKSAMDTTKGVMVRVPVNAQGEEIADKAEIRFYQGDEKVQNTQELPSTWDQAKNFGSSAEVNGTNLDKDSSTHGWWRYRTAAVYQPYYYYYYRPTFYYQTYYWTYSTPVYYTTYYYTPAVYAYRYYYYTPVVWY